MEEQSVGKGEQVNVPVDSCPVVGSSGSIESCPVAGSSSSSSLFGQIWSAWNSSTVNTQGSRDHPLVSTPKMEISSSQTAPQWSAAINDVANGQERQPGQTVPLSREREVSTIQKVTNYPVMSFLLYLIASSAIILY